MDISHNLPGWVLKFRENIAQSRATLQIANDRIAISEVTAYPSELNAAMVRQSAATVFISLMANEAQQLQYLACVCLANLLCWEGWSHSAPGAAVRVSESIRKHVELCDGHKVLLGLLTSICFNQLGGKHNKW